MLEKGSRDLTLTKQKSPNIINRFTGEEIFFEPANALISGFEKKNEKISKKVLTLPIPRDTIYERFARERTRTDLEN